MFAQVQDEMSQTISDSADVDRTLELCVATAGAELYGIEHTLAASEIPEHRRFGAFLEFPGEEFNVLALNSRLQSTDITFQYTAARPGLYVVRDDCDAQIQLRRFLGEKVDETLIIAKYKAKISGILDTLGYVELLHQFKQVFG